MNQEHVSETHTASATPPVLDSDMLDQLMSLAGPERVMRFVNNLTAALERFPTVWTDSADATECERLRSAAHQAVALAGQLGFAALADASRDLETACINGTPVTPCLARMHAAAELAKAKIRSLAA